MPRFDITTFGEGGLRLSVPAGHRLSVANQFDIHVAGAEGNVAGALSYLGWQSGWVSALPNTPMGQRIAHEYRSAGIDLSSVVWQDGGRLSIYYVEYATPPRPTKVYFDRKDSCVNQLTPDDINWDYLLDTRLVHLTGITMPLSANCQAIVIEILKRAKSEGITTSFDVNYRNLLWSVDEARSVLDKIFPLVDVLFCSENDARTIFRYEGTRENVLTSLSATVTATHIIMSIGQDGVLGSDGRNIHHVPAKNVGIVDRVGAGDGLAAGVLHGLLQDNFDKGLQYGVTMSALAMSQYGDMVITTPQELEALLLDDSLDIDR